MDLLLVKKGKMFNHLIIDSNLGGKVLSVIVLAMEPRNNVKKKQIRGAQTRIIIA